MDVQNANEEKIIFSISAALFWIKGSISVDNRVIKTSTQNTIAGLIPAGKNDQIFRLDNVQGSSISVSYKLAEFVWGAIIAIIGFVMLGSAFFAGLVILLVGVLMFMNAIKTSLIIQGNGSNYVISLPFFEKGKANFINNKIHDALVYSQDAHDNNRVMASANLNTNAMIEAIRGENQAQATVQGTRTFCSSCGAANDGMAKFCPSCGAEK